MFQAQKPCNSISKKNGILASVNVRDSTVEPVLGDLWFGRPLVLGDHNHWHGSFLTIKYLAWATTCQTRPATGSFGLTDDSFTCYERPDHAHFRQYCRIWSWKWNTKTGGDRKPRSPPKPIVADYLLGGASSLLFTKFLRGLILFIVLELFAWSLSHLPISNICIHVWKCTICYKILLSNSAQRL